MQEAVYHSNYKLEESYWWFAARNHIIRELSKSRSGLPNGAKVLDVGCGTGGFAVSLQGLYEPTCMDTSELALDYCRRRGLNKFFRGMLSDYPKEDAPEGIFMLDVVEHIEDDTGAIKDVYELLSEGGVFIATVPAYMWLWSRHDLMHMHYRRYTKRNFNQLLESQGFVIKYSTYFNTFLFAPAVLKRFYDRMTGEKGEYKPVDEVSPRVNSIFTQIFKSELAFLKRFRFPFGVSILTIAERASTDHPGFDYAQSTD